MYLLLFFMIAVDVESFFCYDRNIGTEPANGKYTHAVQNSI